MRDEDRCHRPRNTVREKRGTQGEGGRHESRWLKERGEAKRGLKNYQQRRPAYFPRGLSPAIRNEYRKEGQRKERRGYEREWNDVEHKSLAIFFPFKAIFLLVPPSKTSFSIPFCRSYLCRISSTPESRDNCLRYFSFGLSITER